MNRKLTAAAAAVMLTACIVLDSRFTLETTEYSARFDDLPPEFDGFRIAVSLRPARMSFGKDNSVSSARVGREAGHDRHPRGHDNLPLRPARF